ncbi:kelch repeat-containing protein [Nocardioides xinjiangensis]|uniref:kelch repeat-containing protein n=1 Tax=Nocardioides xinjiangensis TaxID=2817376 RepID=UPI001B30BF12|nr:kelch repeat-containing protein [Nocardioides sp. SYSU D00514]
MPLTRWISVLAALTTLMFSHLAVVAEAATAQAGWSRTGDMATGGMSFPAIELPSGQVLMAPGRTTEVFDPTTATFSRAGSLTVDRGWAFSGTLLHNGKILFAGGQAGDTSLASAELYDPVTGTSTPTGDMSAARSFHTATLLADGRVLITGGHRFNFRNSALASAEIYDPATRSFAPTGDMNISRQDHTATLLVDGRVLVAGGYNDLDDPPAQATAELFDPDSGTFAPTASMTAGRGNHTATKLRNGMVLIAGGHSGHPGASVASAELYDPATGLFAPTGDMSDSRGSHTATVLSNGTVLLAGGFTAFPYTGSTLASAEIYEPSTGTFTSTANMHTARGRHAAASLPGGDVLVAGGESGERAEVYSSAVSDTRAPTITTPGDMTITATDAEGALVSYAASATDNIDPDPDLSCEPLSQSTFPLGVTTVTCTAIDNSGNQATASFTITVLRPLDIGMEINPWSLLTPKTGGAILSGSITCDRNTHVYVFGDLTQTVTSAQVTGPFYTEIDCSPPRTSWHATVTPTTRRYVTGDATLSITAYACDQQGSCDREEHNHAIRLRNN